MKTYSPSHHHAKLDNQLPFWQVYHPAERIYSTEESIAWPRPMPLHFPSGLEVTIFCRAMRTDPLLEMWGGISLERKTGPCVIEEISYFAELQWWIEPMDLRHALP